MRREAKLVVAVLVLVVGPTAVLSLLTARVLKNWQIVIEKQLETDAERALLTVADNLASTFATGQEQATRGVAEALGRENNQARLVSFAAAFCRANEWADRLLVVRVPEGVIYPPPLSGACVSGVERARDTEGARNDPESPQAMRQKALHLQYQHGDFEGAAHEYAALFERADAPADLRCEAGLRLAQCYRKAGRAPQAAAVLRSVMSGDPERKAEARVPVDAGPLVRDPEEGYLYALTAAQVLTELLQETGAPAAALDNEMTLLARFVAAYSDVVPCQRATLLADIDRRTRRRAWPCCAPNCGNGKRPGACRTRSGLRSPIASRGGRGTGRRSLAPGNGSSRKARGAAWPSCAISPASSRATPSA